MTLKERASDLIRRKKHNDAVKLLEEICHQDPLDYSAWLQLGQTYLQLGKPIKAIESYKVALNLKGNDTPPLIGIAEAYSLLGNHTNSEYYCEKVLKIRSNIWEAHFILGNISREQSRFDKAEQHYQNALQYKPDHAITNYYIGNIYKTQGRTVEAEQFYNRALESDPNLAEAYWNKLRLLPVIFDNEQQLSESRRKYRKGLEALNNNLNLRNQEERKLALRGISTSTNFYLQYQGMDDLELQCTYGDLIQRVVSANFPHRNKPMDMLECKPGERIRIGYCSAYLRNHNGANWLLGWLRHRNKNEFEIFCYHTGKQEDQKTSEFRVHSDHFRHTPGNLEKVCTQIVNDRLHVLVYPELGMDPQTMITAGLRLAPVQCMGWGHPITSGLKTIDYMLSSDLMEPENGQAHYIEKLIRLPNMGNCYSTEQMERLSTSPPPKSRHDFGLPEDAVLYFCSQSLFKYLPQYDLVWPEIARRLPVARFVFVAISSVHVVRRFIKRIEKAFKAHNLSASDYCIMLNRQSAEDYISLNRLMDVFLDNPPWSGNNTSLTSVDCGVPIVTYPTTYMRGRHSYAILSLMGIHDTIADSLEEYIDIAVRLGGDSFFRDSAREQLLSNRNKIYEDTSVAIELDSFYKNIVLNP